MYVDFGILWCVQEMKRLKGWLLSDYWRTLWYI